LFLSDQKKGIGHDVDEELKQQFGKKSNKITG
jgi:hypothetical protein